MRAAKVQASLRIRAVSPEPSLLAHTSSESRGTLRQKATSLAQLNGWACAVEICHDGMLEDTNSLDGAQLFFPNKRLNHSSMLLLNGFNNMFPTVQDINHFMEVGWLKKMKCMVMYQCLTCDMHFVHRKRLIDF